MLNYDSNSFEPADAPHPSSNLLLGWLSQYATPSARREEAERLAEYSQSQLDTLGLSLREVNAYLGRPRDHS